MEIIQPNRPWPIELDIEAWKLSYNLNFIQGAGGNLSVKIDDEIWIKRSGTSMKNALNSEIFVGLNLEVACAIAEKKSMDFKKALLSAQNHSNPSIETNLHVLMPKKYVIHLHSLGSISLGLLTNAPSSLIDFDKEFVYVDYATPGVDLAEGLLKYLTNRVDTYVLRNHGLLVCGDNLDEVIETIWKFELAAINFIERLPRSLTGTLNKSEILTGGVMTPDESVFLGKSPFRLCNIECNEGICISESGTILVKIGENNEDVLLFCTFYNNVAALLANRITEIRYLETNEVNKLVTWDREVARRAVK